MPSRARGRARGAKAPNRSTVVSRDSSPGEQFAHASPTRSEFEEGSAGSSAVESDASSLPVHAAHQSPFKRKNGVSNPSINKLSDLEAWGYSDVAIIAAACRTYRSVVYPHYNITIRRILDDNQQPKEMFYQYICRQHPENHAGPLFRSRKTGGSEGTTNLLNAMVDCDNRSGKSAQLAAEQITAVPDYTAEHHRALLVMRSAKHARPFNSYADEDYKAEVQLLRPGTKVPSPATISRDLNRVYLHLSDHVKAHFLALSGAIHLALDGWTAPILSSYLGLVVIWYEKGEIYRAVLEFIKLQHRHTGKYLAEMVFDCLERFGIMKKVMSVCMDNASNMDTFTTELAMLYDDFDGMEARLRCLAHIINLVAQIFIAFFFVTKRKKKQAGTIPSDASSDESDEAVAEEDVETAEAEQNDDDEGQAIFNRKITNKLQVKAIEMMAAKGYIIDAEEEKEAGSLFPKISGLARRVRDSPAVKEKFDTLVTMADDLEGQRATLPRRVPTRWNSDLECLLGYLHFKDVLEDLTATRSLRLSAYQLTDNQWLLSEDVREVLLLFESLTLLFSQAEVPLIVDALPCLENLRGGLIAARDDSEHEVFDVMRVACQASILVIEKYQDLIENNDIYIFAIVMCPDRKTKWLKDHYGFSRIRINEIKKNITKKWEASYKQLSTTQDRAPSGIPRGRPVSRYAPQPSVHSQLGSDHIKTYLDEPVLHSETIHEAGGYMKYWERAMSARPSLARMGSDYCSAPATSVDAERAFSTGRRQLNFLQHNKNSQTFRAQMALGSWARTPLFPGIEAVSNIIGRHISDTDDGFLEDEDGEELSD